MPDSLVQQLPGEPAIPWNNCSAISQYNVACHLRFADGRCDSECLAEECLFDGWDCEAETETKIPYVGEKPCPLESDCSIRYADGYCDSECNNLACHYDGGDCWSSVSSEQLFSPLLESKPLLQATTMVSIAAQAPVLSANDDHTQTPIEWPTVRKEPIPQPEIIVSKEITLHKQQTPQKQPSQHQILNDRSSSQMNFSLSKALVPGSLVLLLARPPNEIICLLALSTELAIREAKDSNYSVIDKKTRVGQDEEIEGSDSARVQMTPIS
ncbi:unnamed protein product, partial [Protopolystoma xenopodis]